MSVRRLIAIVAVPIIVKKVFHKAGEPLTSEERLWRERAARMTLDALGHTNLTVKPKRHNDAVRYARRWFRQMFENHPDPWQTDDAEATFDVAGLVGFRQVRDAVLAVEPRMFPEATEDDDE